MTAALLLGPHDPPPFETLNPESTSRVLLVCDLMRGVGEEAVFGAPEFKPWADQVAELLVYD